MKRNKRQEKNDLLNSLKEELLRLKLMNKKIHEDEDENE